MKSHLGHVQIYIDYDNKEFYGDLMGLLGWSVFHEEEWETGYRSGQNGDVWIAAAAKEGQTDHDAIGVNHIAVQVETMDDIETVGTFLKERNVPVLFGTPRHRPEFAPEGQTYYQIDFESLDKILFEVVYIGPKH